jgi:hypothetical protein
VVSSAVLLPICFPDAINETIGYRSIFFDFIPLTLNTMHLLTSLLSPLVPLASHWAKREESKILKSGRALTPQQLLDAKATGVAHPERIRIKLVRSIKAPDGLLGFASKLADAFGPDVAGMTLGYGILIRKDCEHYRANRALYLHEFVHTAQYENYGSIHAFLVDYLRECVDPGYGKGPLERQADRTAKKIVRAG